MPYTCAFIQEMFRYRTLGSLGITHTANANTNINGYVIPKGMQVCMIFGECQYAPFNNIPIFILKLFSISVKSRRQTLFQNRSRNNLQ